MIGDVIFNFVKNTISGDIFVSQTYEPTLKKISEKFVKSVAKQGLKWPVILQV